MGLRARHGRLRSGRVEHVAPAGRRRQHDRQRGTYVAPKLVKATVGPDGSVVETAPSEARSVVTEQAAIQTTEMMRNVVCYGTATRAQVDGLSIAGKTGTAFKAADNGTYFDDDGNRIYYASFVGFFPAEDPQVTVLVSIDEPPAGDRRPLRWHGCRPGVRRARADAHPRTRHRPQPRRSRLPAAVSSPMPDAVGSPGADPAGLREPPRDPSTRASSSIGRARLARVVPGSLYACLRGEHFDGHDVRRRRGRAPERRRCSSTTTLDGVGGRRRSSSTTPGGGWVRSPPRSPATRAARSTTVGITGTNGKTTTAAPDGRDPRRGRAAVRRHRHAPRRADHARSARTAALLREFVDGRQVGRSDGGVVARPGDAPRRRHRVRRRRVHQPRPRPPRPPRLAGGVLPRPRPGCSRRSLRRSGVVNADDTYGRLLADTAASDVAGSEFRVVTYCIDDVSDVEVTAGAHRYRLARRRVEVPLGGGFNVANALAALTTAAELGIDIDVAVRGVSAARRRAGAVRGRRHRRESPTRRRPWWSTTPTRPTDSSGCSTRRAGSRARRVRSSWCSGAAATATGTSGRRWAPWRAEPPTVS